MTSSTIAVIPCLSIGCAIVVLHPLLLHIVDLRDQRTAHLAPDLDRVSNAIAPLVACLRAMLFGDQVSPSKFPACDKSIVVCKCMLVTLKQTSGLLSTSTQLKPSALFNRTTPSTPPNLLTIQSSPLTPKLRSPLLIPLQIALTDRRPGRFNGLDEILDLQRGFEKLVGGNV